ncbi:MAG: hypothetical protein K9J74_01310 [Sulfuritalea sp.]|nr:hypothetical protein [Sulfuritalea sp.]
MPVTLRPIVHASAACRFSVTTPEYLAKFFAWLVTTNIHRGIQNPERRLMMPNSAVDSKSRHNGLVAQRLFFPMRRMPECKNAAGAIIGEIDMNVASPMRYLDSACRLMHDSSANRSGGALAAPFCHCIP